MPILDRQEIMEAERLFAAALNYNKNMTKRRARPLRRPHGYGGRLATIKPDDVIDELKKMGINISRQTLLNYEKWGLIPEAARGSAGRGKGRTTEYPYSTVAEAYASFEELHGDSVIRNTPGRVALIRRAVLNGDWPGELDGLSSAGLPDQFRCIWGIKQWWINYSLCKHNLPLPHRRIENIFPLEHSKILVPTHYPDLNVELDDPRIAKFYDVAQNGVMVEIYTVYDTFYMFVYRLDRALKKWFFSYEEKIHINVPRPSGWAQEPDTIPDQEGDMPMKDVIARNLENELAILDREIDHREKELALSRKNMLRAKKERDLIAKEMARLQEKLDKLLLELNEQTTEEEMALLLDDQAHLLERANKLRDETKNLYRIR